MNEARKTRYEVVDQVGILTFDNPKNLNGLDFQVIDEMNEILDAIAKSRDIGCLILTGAGEKAFMAGGDIGMQLEFDVQTAYEWACLGHRTLRRFEKLPFPVIGAINGYALGGGTEVALVCDILIASRKAVFGQPEITLGIIPGYGGTQRLPRKIGLNRACEYIFTGRRFDAEEAHAIGLVNHVVEPEQLMPRAMEMAKHIVSLPPEAMRMCKAATLDGMQADLDTGLQLEHALFSRTFATERQKEEMRKFLERSNKPKK